METVLLGPDDVEASVEMGEIVSAVEDAFRAYALGDAEMPAKSYIDLPQYDGDFRSMPAYLEADDWEAASVKWVNSHTNNPERHGLPTVMGTVIYSDPDSAFPLAVMDGTKLTMYRTGAAAAVATDHLAREDATSLGLVGAGAQSHTQLEAIAEVRPITEVVVADRNPDAIEEFFELYGDDYDVREGSIEEAAACDVVSTTTPVREPIVETVAEGTHVNAMGADAEGKHEIADSVLEAATIVIDDYDQCTHSGEINVPFSAGVLGDADIHAELGDVVAGHVEGRTSDEEITLFDSTGLAIQDVAASHVVYERADERDLGTPFELVGTDL